MGSYILVRVDHAGGSKQWHVPADEIPEGWTPEEFALSVAFWQEKAGPGPQEIPGQEPLPGL